MLGIDGDGRQGVMSILELLAVGVIASKIPFTISTKVPLPVDVTDMKGGTTVNQFFLKLTKDLTNDITLRSTSSSTLAAALIVLSNQKML